MRFKDFVGGLDEVTSRFKGNVTRDTRAVVSSLGEKLSGGRAIDPKLTVDTIRHNFTDYDVKWRALEKERLDPCDHAKQWNELVTSVAELVGRFVSNYLPPEQHHALLTANAEWLKGKFKRLPPGCDEDDDPRKYRTLV